MKALSTIQEEREFFYTDRASDYDATAIRINSRYIHAHQVQNKIIEQSLGSVRCSRPIILDFGCGTGSDAVSLLQRIPHAYFCGIDFSSAMLVEAEAKSRSYGVFDRVAFIQEDIRDLSESKLRRYLKLAFGQERAHATISALTLHHFDSAQKLGAYQLIYSTLEPGQLFVNTDLVSSRIPRLASQFLTEELADIERGLTEDNSVEGLDTQKEVDEWTHHYIFDNRPIPLEEEFSLLDSAGFCAQDIAFRQSQMSVIVASRD